MREMTGDAMVFESLLNLYYDESAKYFLNQRIIGMVDSFVMGCKAKDMIDETNIVESMEIIYNPQIRMSKDEVKNKLALSDSSLYRLRVKIISALNKYISDNMTETE